MDNKKPNVKQKQSTEMMDMLKTWTYCSKWIAFGQPGQNHSELSLVFATPYQFMVQLARLTTPELIHFLKLVSFLKKKIIIIIKKKFNIYLVGSRGGIRRLSLRTIYSPVVKFSFSIELAI